ncbi:DNA polymerase III subunit beta [Ketogulonicigenium vulgare]|uniref:Beta sliding clamp n=1 Tax=Ketogulonicigenium vulgare (strain WSH-001) TaxID=759362 RepID=F9YA28_KETVW|nr:DNA polymerase III subunit beta [Ketogulonicigenium vulgare]ADO43141.1 DNA polymerase III subunit beta [Ketogulonicigenium vulgare Y25]AEM41439.1 DNA polymerase III subunit beta [Ketogulonicigenium vulgare WSH-001]ALJ81572.1 DNA polymerase III subunit beta [Ketogulonicigenium vulgare]ANW34258.1 DNA polymerase III subunit beta [Ketogulonicigenium vulgare]AOZ55178.1 DNA polymerase III subunit beta [Ketogulonicigenium vulgare]
MTDTVSAIIDRHALRKAMTSLQRTVQQWAAIPALKYISISSGLGEVTLRATDLDNLLTIKLEAETTGTVPFLVSAEVLQKFASLAAGPVTVTRTPDIEGKDALITITDQETTLRLRERIQHDDFPTVPAWDMKDAARFTGSGAELSRILDLSRHCVSTEETRYYLNGIYLITAPERSTLRAVATDGHRMAVIDSNIEAPNLAGVIFPRFALDVFRGLLDPKSNTPIKMQFEENRGIIEGDDWILHSKMIDGTFPDYTRVIPKHETNCEAHFTRAIVTKAHRLSQAVRGHIAAAATITSDGKMHLMHEGEDESVSVPVGASPNFDLGRHGFNVKYLNKQAQVTPEFTLRASTERPNDPATIVSDDPDACWILMPMRAA